MPDPLATPAELDVDAGGAAGDDTAPATEAEVAWFIETFEAVAENIEVAMLGKPHVVRLVVTCLVAGGHLLIEDVPGTGKTMLARSLARTIAVSHARIQFTPDLLPSDVTGVSVYDQHSGKFTFHPGPVFSSLVIADEINRASPKTQSALLEVMEEAKVTVDGVAHAIPRPFMVIATQNPIELAGTYRLPEAQLDRFLMRTSLGYLDAAATEELLLGADLRDRAAALPAVVNADEVEQMSDIADCVHVDGALAAYVRRIAEASREHDDVRLGMSARGALAYMRVAKAWAAAHGRTYVVPEDIATLAEPVLGHRLLLNAEAAFDGVHVEDVITDLLAAVPAPDDRA